MGIPHHDARLKRPLAAVSSEMYSISPSQLQDFQRTITGLGLELEDIRATVRDETSHRIAADRATFDELGKLRSTVDELLETMLGVDAVEHTGTWPQESSAARVDSNQGPSHSRAEDAGNPAFKEVLLGLEASMSEQMSRLCKDEFASLNRDFSVSLKQLETHVAEVGQSLADHLLSHRLKQTAPSGGGALKQLEAHVAEMRVHADALHRGGLANPDTLQAISKDGTLANTEKASAGEAPVVSADFVRLSPEQVGEELERFQRDAALQAAVTNGAVEAGAAGMSSSVASSAAIYPPSFSPSFCDASSLSRTDLLELDADEVAQARTDMEFLRGIMQQHQETLQRGNR